MRHVCSVVTLMVVFLLTGAAGGPRVAAASRAVWAQESPIPPFQIAAPFPGETAFEMVGRSEHHESSMTSYGYLSAVAGIDQSQAFAEPESPSAATARFTYYAQLDQPSVPAPGSVSVRNAEGTLTVYFNERGGSAMDDPDSFFRGDPVATMQMQLQDVLQREAPDIGVVIGEGMLTQVFDAVFSFDGEEYRFGHTGLQDRLIFTGTTIGDETDSMVFMASFAGHATVTGFQAPDDGAGSATGTPAVDSPTAGGDETPRVDAACEGVEAWLGEAVVRAERAEAIIAGIPATASVQSLDPEVIDDAVVELAELAQGQRDVTPPEVGRAANSLLVTALSTLSRGTNLIERAIADQDEDALSSALDILQDGDDLILRARDQLVEVGTSCDIET